MPEKPLLWVGASYEAVRRFPKEAQRRAGYQLHRVQTGLEPQDWKPMPGVGPGIREIRIHSGRAFRILYLASYPEGVYVLHAFEKRTQRTNKLDLDVARERLKAVHLIRLSYEV